MSDDRVSELLTRVLHLERQVAYLMERLGIDALPMGGGGGVDPDVLAAVRRGDKIGAIKLYRERTGVDLREAKDHVESLR
jgi:ribosomal protein L7/L12